MNLAFFLLGGSLLLSWSAAAEELLRRGSAGEPDTLDPHKSTLAVEASIIEHYLTGLMRVDAEAKAKPGGAVSWEVSEDGLNYEFLLRDDAVWSDGAPVTAEDYVAGFQRLFNPETAAINASLFFVIKNAREATKGEIPVEHIGVKALSPDRLRIELKHPDPLLLQHLTNRVTTPVPRHVVERHGNDWMKPGIVPSNGAFILKTWSAHESVELVRNPRYYAADDVALDGVKIFPSDNAATGVKQYRAGEVDFQDTYPTNDYEHLRKILGDEVKRSTGLTISYLVFNFENPLYQDLRVRRALSLAINREVIAEKVMRGMAVPAYRYTPMTVADYEGDELAFKSMAMEARLSEARALLAEAGYSKANPLKVTYNAISGLDGKAVSLAIRAMWKQIGVETIIDTKEMRVHYSNMDHQNFDIGFSSWIGYDDPHQYLSALISTKGEISYNSGHYSNADYDRLIAEGVEIADLKARFAKFGEAETIMLEEVALIPIYMGSVGNLVKPYLEGYVDNPYDAHISEVMRIGRTSQ